MLEFLNLITLMDILGCLFCVKYIKSLPSLSTLLYKLLCTITIWTNYERSSCVVISWREILISNRKLKKQAIIVERK